MDVEILRHFSEDLCKDSFDLPYDAGFEFIPCSEIVPVDASF